MAKIITQGYEKHFPEPIILQNRQEIIIPSDTLFSNYIRYWLTSIKTKVDDITFQGYRILAETQILPYFDKMGISVQAVTYEILQAYFDEKSKNGKINKKGGLSARSLRLHKNIISQSLDMAVKNRMISSNPCKWVTLPPILRREPSFYSAEQIKQLLQLIKDEPLYLLIKMTAFYGLRRSEVLGLQWQSVNFDAGLISIRHTVVKVDEVVEKDKTKTTSSYRSFPLMPAIEEDLLKAKKQQRDNRKALGNKYHESQYVFVWNDGRPYAPDYITSAFRKLLIKYNMPIIRFHDLRHSCASILLSNGFEIKDVQEWLGHADIKTTANIYGHLNMKRKKAIASGMMIAIS